MQPFSTPTSVALVAVAVFVLAAGPTIPVPGEADGISSRAPVAFPTASWGVPVTLTVGGLIGSHTANPFFAVTYSVTGISPAKHAAQGAFFNSTPISWYRLGEGGENYDPTTQTVFSPPPGGGTFRPGPGQLVNLTAFKTWCLSRTPTCQWLAFLPGEENNTQAAVHYATWFHDVLGFVPTYWEFGNEPSAWTHYGKNLTTWSTHDNLTPTALDYATMVHDYIAAISAIFPNDRYVGIEAPCACDPTMISETASAVGDRVAAMAYHEFPSANGSVPTDLAQYYAALGSSSNILNTSAHFRSIYAANCTICPALPVEIGAYQAGPSGNLSDYAATYAGAPFMAASIIEALEANVSMFTLFSSDWMYNSSTGGISAEGYLYQGILANLTMGRDISVAPDPAAPGGIYALLLKNGSRESLFVVNTNVSRTLDLQLNTTVFPVGQTGSFWVWNPLNLRPGAFRQVTLPTHYLVSPQGILLINNY